MNLLVVASATKPHSGLYPQRFYPLLELLELFAAIKPNAAAGEEGTE